MKCTLQASDRPRFVFLLTLAQRRVQRWVLAEGDGTGATRNGLLMLLPQDMSGRPLGELALGLGLGPSSLSGLVDRTSQAGLVERVSAPTDGRSILLQLTEQGLALRQSAVEQARTLNARLTDGFNDDELAIVARWLRAACDNFEKDEH